ncbi:hypothetical protein P9273_28950 [Mesorhizobium sp. WSM4935]|uniref:hypothetical protein n=1 Tax=Mesorhizobium sp. WSM4935 TaxID=3038547 RepID=UPI002414F258|nr:hypothetical protein [Mesorhizobium sp. WSM4935]MDG4879110.1 hypothetical protein [Mesorhizobium sp. WSM4935]
MSSCPIDILEPDDMIMLERVLNRLLPEGDASEKEWLASVLVAAFQAGTRDEASLLIKMRDMTKPA